MLLFGPQNSLRVHKTLFNHKILLWISQTLLGFQWFPLTAIFPSSSKENIPISAPTVWLCFRQTHPKLSYQGMTFFFSKSRAYLSPQEGQKVCTDCLNLCWSLPATLTWPFPTPGPPGWLTKATLGETTAPYTMNSIYLPWTCFFISLAGSSHVCKRIKTLTVYQTFQKHHRKLKIAKNTGEKIKKDNIWHKGSHGNWRERVFFTSFSPGCGLYVYFQPFTYQGLIREAGVTRGGKKKANY